MLSYRHAFHAGSPADVLKHTVLVQLLHYLARKDKAYWYIDTHAGAGVYSLTEGYATQRAEFEMGIAKLWALAASRSHSRSDVPTALADYIAQVSALNPPGKLHYYPGSPYLAWQLMRSQDRMRLFELHTTEIDILQQHFRDAGQRVMLYAGDGFKGINALLPPAPRRALVLIDPSFEDKRDYARTLECIDESLKRFATGIYAVWYPQVVRRESQRFADQFKQQLKRLPPVDWLHVTLTVSQAPTNGLGLYGSGMFILNPPYTLAASMKEALPYLTRALGQDTAAQFTLEKFET